MSDDPKKAKAALNAATLVKKKKEEQERQAQLQQSGPNQGNFMQLQLVLQGGKWQQEQISEQFTNAVKNFMQNNHNPACSLQNIQNTPGLQNGAAMQITGLTPERRTVIAAAFLADQISQQKEGQFAINIGHSDPASAVKSFASKNVLDKVARLTYEKEGQSRTLEQEGIKQVLQQGLQVAQNIADAVTKQQSSTDQAHTGHQRKPWDVRVPTRPRPPGEDN